MTKYADGNTVITTGKMFAQQFWAGFGGRESGDGAASGRRMTAQRKNLAAGREGRLLINAGAEAGRGAGTQTPHHIAGTSGRLAVVLRVSGRLTKAPPQRRQAGVGGDGRRARLQGWLGSDHASCGTVTLDKAGTHNR